MISAMQRSVHIGLAGEAPPPRWASPSAPLQGGEGLRPRFRNPLLVSVGCHRQGPAGGSGGWDESMPNTRSAHTDASPACAAGN